MNLRYVILVAMLWSVHLAASLPAQQRPASAPRFPRKPIFTTIGQTQLRGMQAAPPAQQVLPTPQIMPAPVQRAAWVEEDLPLPPAAPRQNVPPAAAAPSEPEVIADAPELEPYIVDDAEYLQDAATWDAPAVMSPAFVSGHAHGHGHAHGGPFRLPRGLYGEMLYLRPGNDKISFAVPVDGASTSTTIAPVQIGDEATVDADFAAGYRVGGDVMLNPYLSLGLSYTKFHADDDERVTTRSPFVLRSIVSHPGTRTTSRDFLEGRAEQDIRFDLIDVILTREWLASDNHLVAWQLGPRFGSLDQEFQSTMTSSTLIETVRTEVDFDGGGLAFGLVGVRRIMGIGGCPCPQCAKHRGWSLYGKALASVLGGKMHTSYIQSDNFTRDAIVRTGWEDDRLVPTLDIEFGLNWISPSDRLRLSAGYLFSAWYGIVTTDEFIDGVRRNSSLSISDTMTFDGLTASAEWRF